MKYSKQLMTIFSLIVCMLICMGCGSTDKPVPETPLPAPSVPAVEVITPEPVEPEAPAVPIIESFENDKTWSMRLSEASAVKDSPGITEGSQALQVIFEKSELWPAVTINCTDDYKDWSGFMELKADIYVMGDKAQWLGTALGDVPGLAAGNKGYATSGTTLKAGANTYRIKLDPMRTRSGRILDYTQMSFIQFFLDKPKSEVSIVIDNIRLEGKSLAEPDAVAGLHAFDFGPAKSAAWPGFNLVTPDSVYTEQQGYGWADKVTSGSSNTKKPDSLAGDQVGFSMSQVREPEVNQFMVDLENGTYQIAMIVRNTVPVRSWGVHAENAPLIENRIDINNVLEHVCRNSEVDYPPQSDVFELFVERDYPVKTFTVTVSDNQLNLDFDTCGVYMLVIAPQADQEALENYLVKLKAERKAEFNDYHFSEDPMPEPKAAAAINDADKANGLIVYTRNYSEEIYTNDQPDAQARQNKAEAFLAKGESEPVSIAVHALEDADVTLTVSDLVSPEGAEIANNQIAVRSVRFFPKINTFQRSQTRMVPMHMWDTDTVTIKKGTTRQFWLTITAPAAAPAGTYSGTISARAFGKSPVTIPLSVQVYDFALPSPEDIPAAFAWFYTSPNWRHENWRLGWFEGPEAEAKKREVLKWELADMQAHGSNCVQLPGPTYIGYENGKVQLDFTDMDMFASVMKELNFGLKHENQVFLLRIGSRLMQRAGLEEFSPEFNAAYLDGVRQVKAWADKHEIPLMYWVVDEPREINPNSWNRNLEDSIKYLELARQVEGIRTTITVQTDERDGIDYTSIIDTMDILQTHPVDKSIKMQTIARERGKPVLKFFNAGKNVNRYPAGFHTWRVESHGLFQWHYHYWGEVANPLQPITGYNWGVSNVVFLTPDGVVPTLWHELMREGIDDYRYLTLLENLIQKAGPDNSDAKAAARLLDDIRSSLPLVVPFELCVGEDGMAYQDPLLQKVPALRAEVAAMISTLQ